MGKALACPCWDHVIIAGKRHLALRINNSLNVPSVPSY